MVAFLIGLFVLFTVGSIIGIRITSRKEIEEAKDELKEKLKTSLANELKDSKAFIESIINDIFGRIDERIMTQSDIEEIDNRLKYLENHSTKIIEKNDAKSEIKTQKNGSKRTKNK